MANREQRSNREKKKPKEDKPKGAPVVSSFTTEFSKAAGLVVELPVPSGRPGAVMPSWASGHHCRRIFSKVGSPGLLGNLKQRLTRTHPTSG